MLLGELIDSGYVKSLRKFRDGFLKDSDWLLTYDNVETLANLDDWIKYRKDLRDFFSDLTKPVILQEDSITWDIYAMGFPKAPPIIRKPAQTT